IGAVAGIPLGATAMWAIKAKHAPVVVAAAPAPSLSPAPAPPVAKVDLVVSSRPSGAQVTVDDEPQGVTPLTLQVAPGSHHVTVAKDRYAPAEETVSAPGRLQLDLKRPTAVLEVASTPPGATVTVNSSER